MITKVNLESSFPSLRLFSLILLACFFAGATLLNAEISPEAGAFFIKQYLPQVYGADPQNWAVVQDTRGVMFFGNNEGLLEYDGARWRHIRLPSANSVVRSLAIDSDGTVYVGGQNEFGFLSPDAAGLLQYVSLLHQVPAADRNFGDIWTISCTDLGVVFGSYERIFRWSRETGMKIWKPATRFGRVFTVDGLPYVVVRDAGLCRISAGYMEIAPGGGLHEAGGNKLEPVPGGGIFKQDIAGAFSFAGSLMVATGSGLFRQQRDHFVNYANDAESFLKKNRIFSCRPLNQGDLAIGTVQGGLLLLEPDGHIDRIIDKRSGLASNYVNAIYADRAGSLWLALNRGIAHLENQLPLTRFGDLEGVDEVALAINRQGPTLYVGTMSGLSRLVPARSATPHFEPVAGVAGQVLALLPTPEMLLAGGQYGIEGVTSDGVHRILDQGLIFSLSRSIQKPNLVLAAGRRGLFVLQWNGRTWKKTRQVASEGQEFLSAIQDSDGRVWATTHTAVWRINLSSDPAEIQRYTEVQGVPGGWNYAYHVQNSIVFATAKGLRRFNSQSGHLVPDTRFGKMFADGSHTVFKIAETPVGDIWIGGDTYQGILHRTSYGYRWESDPLARADIKELIALHIDPDKVVWAAGANGGLVRYAASGLAGPTVSFPARIDDVRLLRSGDFLGLTKRLPKVSHQQDSLGFEFSAPYFEDESRTEYQVRLDGLDHAWSEWGSETRKEYTNLWEGNYVFHVRARDLNGRISEPAVFAFRVLRPWYRTWFAYATYALLLIGLMALIIKWRLHTLEASNRKLESIIENRTEEIRQQRDEIKLEEERTEALLLNILPAPVAHELRATGSVQPMAFDEITVCFTDFVGFTLSSEKVTAAELVAGLHRYFTTFDEIVGRYRLEKLKTIGDSYMFVGGLPDLKPSHAVDVVMAALEMIEAVNALSTSHPNWQIRIGIHSGPVVAGVVGVKKFAFDIWGQTVNFASRFESSGVPNHVNISSRTRELVCDFIDCEPRGAVRIKEGRQLEMYFARQVRSELLGGNVDGIPARFSELYYRRFGQEPPAFLSAKSPTADASQAILSV